MDFQYSNFNGFTKFKQPTRGFIQYVSSELLITIDINYISILGSFFDKRNDSVPRGSEFSWEFMFSDLEEKKGALTAEEYVENFINEYESQKGIITTKRIQSLDKIFSSNIGPIGGGLLPNFAASVPYVFIVFRVKPGAGQATLKGMNFSGVAASSNNFLLRVSLNYNYNRTLNFVDVSASSNLQFARAGQNSNNTSIEITTPKTDGKDLINKAGNGIVNEVLSNDFDTILEEGNEIAVCLQPLTAIAQLTCISNWNE